MEAQQLEAFDASDMAELPLFANDEAKEIYGKIMEKRGLSEKASKELTDNVERISVMEEHMKNVRLEVTHTNGLLTAKEKEMKSEKHATELARREAGRYAQEVRREQADLEKHEAQLNTLQNQVFEANEAMDKFKLQMNWNQEELEQWALAAKQKDEDNLALERYTRADESKIKALALQIEKLTKLDLQKKMDLDDERTDAAARQIELDRTAKEFRTLHSERQQLVQQWKEAIETAHKRDNDIAKVATEYLAEKQKKKDQLSAFDDAKQELEKRKAKNFELEATIGQMERQVQTKRDDVIAEKDKLQRLHDDIDVLKSELASSARALARKRKENERATDAVATRKAQLEKCRKDYHLAKERYDAGEQSTADVEATAQEAEAELIQAQQDVDNHVKNIAALKDVMFKQSQALFALRQDEANFIAEISGAQSQGRNLQSKIRQLDAESVRQQELLYSAEFQIQQMERKVSRGLGERSDSEKQQFLKQIKKLEGDLDAAKDEKKMLTNQCRRLGNELRAAQRHGDLVKQQQKDIDAKITELELENVAADQSLKVHIATEEQAMVQNDMMRLELKRLRDALSSRADKVFTLENRKQQLQLSMRERKKQISVHRDVQAAQLRLAEEERHKAQLDVGQRRHQVQKLTAKYDILRKSSKLRAQDDDDDAGEPKSQAYYLILAAQKREELQRQGDELDQEIRRREREMRALEATLNHVTTQNSDYRQSFQKANMQSAEAEDLHQLEEQSKLAKDALFRRTFSFCLFLPRIVTGKKELQRLATDLEEDERRLEQVEHQCARLEERNGNLLEAQKQMEIELEAQDEALEKVSKRLNRLASMHRDQLGTSSETAQEKTFRADGIFDSNQSVIETLNELGNAYPEVRDVLATMLVDAGLTDPPTQ